MAIPIATVIFMLAATTPWAATLSGTVRVGGIFLDEEGDRSTVQETYNVYDGFALSRIQLTGTFDPRSTFMLDLRDLNLDSRSGDLTYRMPGRFKLRAAYDQNRYVFDPGRGITSERKDWKLGLQFTPNRWLALSGDVGRVTREGERLAFPLGTVNALGDRYDNALLNAQVTADVRADRRGGGVSLRMSDYSDELNAAADRRGQVVAARLYAPMPFYDRWTNLLRGSYGTRELIDGGVEYTLSSAQYTAVVQPRDAYELKYAFDASRVDDTALDLQTDRFQNDFDLAWFHRYGRVNAGYGYETNDDDRTLTSYQSWRAGTTFRPDRRLTARVDYAGRVKKDQEELTLLKDVESSRIRARLEFRPVEQLTIGGDYAKRERELPDIQVSVDGAVTGAFARYELQGWGTLSADYSHAVDEYVDRLAGFDTQSDIVTARVEVGRIKNLRLASGVTYLDIGRDLDIEKSMVFVEGALKIADRYHLEVKYNVYNYDDYILIDRYYTANVVRIDLGYDL
jgi:hypothetical protein